MRLANAQAHLAACRDLALVDALAGIPVVLPDLLPRLRALGDIATAPALSPPTAGSGASLSPPAIAGTAACFRRTPGEGGEDGTLTGAQIADAAARVDTALAAIAKGGPGNGPGTKQKEGV